MENFNIGARFGRLVITAPSYRYDTAGGYFYMKYPCKCDCGGTKDVRKEHLKEGKVFHCGCVRFTKDGVEHETHDFYDTPIHHSWFAMKQRCTNKNSSMYHEYGGRGITFDPKWDTFMGFYRDMGETYIEGFSIDRIDVNGNYCKENCRWADSHTQGYNRRFSKLNKSGKTGVLWDKKSSKWRVKFRIPGGKQINKWFVYLWDAIYERMLLEQQYHGSVKE